jgi:hypothetical protein
MLILVQRKRKPEYMPESSWDEKIFIDGELEFEFYESCHETQAVTSGDIVKLVTKAFHACQRGEELMVTMEIIK